MSYSVSLPMHHFDISLHNVLRTYTADSHHQPRSADSCHHQPHTADSQSIILYSVIRPLCSLVALVLFGSNVKARRPPLRTVQALVPPIRQALRDVGHLDNHNKWHTDDPRSDICV